MIAITVLCTNSLNALLKCSFSFLLKVRSALDMMITAKCPAEIPTMENTNVKFFRDYETTTTGVSKADDQVHAEDMPTYFKSSQVCLANNV